MYTKKRGEKKERKAQKRNEETILKLGNEQSHSRVIFYVEDVHRRANSILDFFFFNFLLYFFVSFQHIVQNCSFLFLPFSNKKNFLRFTPTFFF